MPQVGGALLVAAALVAVIALEVSGPPADDVARSQTHPAATVPPISSATADRTNDWVAACWRGHCSVPIAGRQPMR